MSAPLHRSDTGPGNYVGPHSFKALRWWDNRHVGRCAACFLPRMAHPVRWWAKARPLGDTRPASLVGVVFTGPPVFESKDGAA